MNSSAHRNGYEGLHTCLVRFLKLFLIIFQISEHMAAWLVILYRGYYYKCTMIFFRQRIKIMRKFSPNYFCSPFPELYLFFKLLELLSYDIMIEYWLSTHTFLLLFCLKFYHGDKYKCTNRQMILYTLMAEFE